MIKFVVRNEEHNAMISSVEIKREEGIMSANIRYVTHRKNALTFETAEEANALITFIGDVIDWETEQSLYCEEIEI